MMLFDSEYAIYAEYLKSAIKLLRLVRKTERSRCICVTI